MNIQKATIQQADMIYQIGLAAFGSQQLPLSVITHELASPRATYWLSENGFIAITQILDEIEINYLAVDPRYQSQGQGRALLEHVLALPNVQRCLLEVARKNSEARKLYQAYGFREYHCRQGYYRNGDDAIMMEKVNDKNHCI